MEQLYNAFIKQHYFRQSGGSSALLCVPWRQTEYRNALEAVVFDAIMHKFHRDKLLFFLEMLVIKNMVMFDLIVLDQKGWALCKTYGHSTGYIEVNFVFVKPEFRRQGWFRHLVMNILSPMNGGCGVFVWCNVQKSPTLFKTLDAMKFKLREDYATRQNEEKEEELGLIWKNSTTTATTELFNQLTEYYVSEGNFKVS